MYKIFFLFFIFNFCILANDISDISPKPKINTEYGIFNDKKSEKIKESDPLSFLAPENFIPVIMFVLIVGGIFVMKKVYFDEDENVNIDRDKVEQNKSKKNIK